MGGIGGRRGVERVLILPSVHAGVGEHLGSLNCRGHCAVQYFSCDTLAVPPGVPLLHPHRDQSPCLMHTHYTGMEDPSLESNSLSIIPSPLSPERNKSSVNTVNQFKLGISYSIKFCTCMYPLASIILELYVVSCTGSLIPRLLLKSFSHIIG